MQRDASLEGRMHIRFLAARWRAEEQSLCQVLDELTAERELAERRAAVEQTVSGDSTVMRGHCLSLDRECDDVATELLHVRLALIGAQEELERAAFCASHDTDATDASEPATKASNSLGGSFTDQRTLLGA